jgi:hypothetical protein
MTGWWVAHEAASDQDWDDKVSLDEVLIVVDQLGAKQSEVLVTANSMFGTIDEDDDGMISSRSTSRSCGPGRAPMPGFTGSTRSSGSWT